MSANEIVTGPKSKVTVSARKRGRKHQPLREHAVHDDWFIRNYKKWLLARNDLTDVAYFGRRGERDARWSDFRLEEFRNRIYCPKGSYIEEDRAGLRWPVKRYRNDFAPTYEKLFAHLVQWGQSAIYAVNDGGHDELLMLADLDNKEGTARVDDAARHLSETYLKGRTYVDPSTFESGRHAYFVLKIGPVDPSIHKSYCRSDVWAAMEGLSDAIKADPIFARFGVTFDEGCLFYGLPTLWTRDGCGVWSVERRGNLLKLPFCPDAGADFEKLVRLEPLTLDDVGQHSAQYQKVICVGQPEMTKSQRGGPKVDKRKLNVNDGRDRKVACIGHMLRNTNGNALLDEVVAEYEAHWNPTGMSPKDRKVRRKKIAQLFEHMRDRYVPSRGPRHGFRRDQYLKLVTEVVPPAAFEWGRREKLDHRRLADFVSMKVQDAFFDKSDHWFGMTGRDASITNSVVLRAKGKIDWQLTTNTYTRLLEIAKQYKLLRVVREYRKPVRDPATGRVLIKGHARLIAPGEALPDERKEWEFLYAAVQKRLKHDVWSSLGAA